MKVLIVDDSPMVREILRDILVQFCDIKEEDLDEAEGGTSAIVKFMQMKPDLVLLDVIMPDMEGAEVVSELRRLDKQATIVMCTVSSDEEDMKECLRAGANGYIMKPPQPGRVVQAVATARGKAAASTEN
jgi:two-component system chemotaxis response regulator CheY